MHKGLQSPSLCSRAARLVCFAVNISIAIIPMAQVSWRMAVRCTLFAVKHFSSGHPLICLQEFGWGAGETGIIQSSFFAGYLLMNLPGGYLASRLGGRRTLPVGLGTWSLATALAPLATTVSGLGLSRWVAVKHPAGQGLASRPSRGRVV